MSKPLEGMRILDLTQYVSGSLCTLLLCDYGAEVLKAEKELLQYETMTDEEKCIRATFHRGKIPIVLNLAEENDREKFWELCEQVDAVIENFRLGVMEGWGITYDTLREKNPAIVYTSISGYGQDGPYAGRGASDPVIQAESGIMSITGPRGKDAVKCGADISSYMTAVMGCIGTMMGVINAKRTGRGRRVDISMLETTMMCLENQLAVYMRDGKIPKPMGNSYDLFAPVGLYKSGDEKEFMLSVGTDGQWRVLCDVLGKPEWKEDPRYVTNMRRVENLAQLDPELRAEFTKYDRETLSEMLQAGRCVYGNINDFKAVEEHPQVKARKMIVRAMYPDGSTYRVPGNPIHMSRMERQTEYQVFPIEKNILSDRTREKTLTVPAREKNVMDRPLDGIRILDFSQFLSGPVSTLLLSDFGAEVIKIENPPLGDNTRYGPYIDSGTSSHYAMRNRGKKSIVLNMKKEEHKQLFIKMVKNADAVVDNYKPGTMEKFGITYDLLKEINPAIVYTSLSGYGQTGPYASHAAFDQTVQAESGIMSVTGEDGGTPMKCGASVADFSAGLVACTGTLMAIYDAQRTGQGRRVDVAMMDSLVFGLETQFSNYLRTGEVPGPKGNLTYQTVPSGAFHCKDGESLMVTVGTETQWKNFCDALEKPEWVTNPEWSSRKKRFEDRERLQKEVEKVFACYNSGELEERLLDRHCVCGHVNDFQKVVSHSQVAHRHTLVDATFPNGVTFRVPGNPIHMSGMKREEQYTAALLGHHTFEVLREVAEEKEVHRIFDPVLEEVRTAEKAVYDKS